MTPPRCSRRSSRRALFLALVAAATYAAACRPQNPDPAGDGAPGDDAASVTTRSGEDHRDRATDGGEPVRADSDAASGEPRRHSADTTALPGATFTEDVRSAARVAACASEGAIPPSVAAATVEAHCAALRAGYDEYQRDWLSVAAPFLAKLRPSDLSKTVVYPFGGGDLVTALATFPDATEITTISLEAAGDVRGVRRAEDAKLSADLATLRDHLGKLFLKAHSKTSNLDIETRGAVPGEIAFSLAALVIHGFEPTTLRYFRFEPDGALHWFTEEEIEAATKPSNVKRSNPFSCAEIRFRRPGDAEDRVFRHVAYDLSDASLKHSPALLRHLDAKGKVSAMTKAASHLLWDDEHFATIRRYLVKNVDWMISDDTGIPPRVASRQGFSQDFYGQYEWPQAFGAVNNRDAVDLKVRFAGNAPLPFRYGYPDAKSQGHLIVTRRTSTYPNAR